MAVRVERPGDFDAIHQVHAAAFGRENEAHLVDRLRGLTSTLSLVAVTATNTAPHSTQTTVEIVVGHLFFSPVTIDRAGIDNSSAEDPRVVGLCPPKTEV